MSGDILDQIDRAIAGYEAVDRDLSVSGDAMRCGPGRPDTAGDLAAELPLRVLLNPHPLVRRVLEMQEAVRILDELGPIRPAAPPPRTPLVDEEQPECARVPLVGGPVHGDLRAFPLPLLSTVIALDTPSPLYSTRSEPDWTFRHVSYRLRRLFGRWPDGSGGPFWVYVIGDYADEQLTEAVRTAFQAGWEPWRETPL